MSNKSLGEQFEELKEITRKFDEEEVDLEKGIPLFKKGMKIAKSLKKRLTKLENEIEEIDF